MFVIHFDFAESNAFYDFREFVDLKYLKLGPFESAVFTIVELQ
jgi:hypothetical protein